MKKALAIVAIIFGLSAWGWELQRPDLASQVTGLVAIQPQFIGNSAVTGTWNDIAAFNAVAIQVQIGLVQQLDSAYIVFQDSSAGLAVASFDSVPYGAGLDSTYTDYNYQRTRRFVRALVRATGAAGDSDVVSVTILGMARSR